MCVGPQYGIASCHPFGATVLGFFSDFWKMCAPLSHAVKHVEELFIGSTRFARIQMKPATIPKRTFVVSRMTLLFVFGTVAGPILDWKAGYSKVFS